MDVYVINRSGWDNSGVFEIYQNYQDAKNRTIELNERDSSNPYGYDYHIQRVEVK